MTYEEVIKNATPRPWRDDLDMVVYMGKEASGFRVRKADEALARLAVNSHEAMREALRISTECLEAMQPEWNFAGRITLNKAALALAEGREK